jgi:hypothetical protein
MPEGDSSSQGGEPAVPIHWTVKLEEYFASTGEKAHCLAWVHKKAESMYSTRKTWIDLPVIVGSGMIAFLNAASPSMFTDAKVASIALGIGSLAVGVLNTMGSYFGWAKRAEGHRISAIHYSKLFRFITIELALPREERMNPHDFLKYVKDQYDRLQEISPLVPVNIVLEFQKRFKDETEISKPEETNGLEKITIYRRADEEEDAGRPTPKPQTPSVSVKSPSSFSTVNPMRAATKKEEKKEEKKDYVPTLKAVKEATQSAKLPEVPAELVRPVSPGSTSS